MSGLLSPSGAGEPGVLPHRPRRATSLAGLLRFPLFGFGSLHAGNTLLNMGFNLVQLLVLARILPMARYSEVVFLMTIGFYVQPFNQAFGKANFVILREIATRTTRMPPEPGLVLAGEGTVLLLMSLAVPCGLAAFGTGAWTENALFLFLCLSINFWAFDLQSTAWSMGLNLPFVRLSLLHRSLHLGALLAAYGAGSFLLFGVLATVATLGCLAAALCLLGRAGLFASVGPTAWRSYLATFRIAFLSTLTDFFVLNAPYGLIAMRFGVGPMLIVFDSVMKLARITLAGSRTLAEIALPRHGRLLESGDRRGGRRLFVLVLALCFGASLVPALAVALAGPAMFKLLLGANNVVPVSAMVPAAVVIVGCSVYQPAVFFLGYGNERGAVQALTLVASAALIGFAALLQGQGLDPATVLALFGSVLVGLGLVAVFLTNGLFASPRTRTDPNLAASLQQVELLP